jgi:hypothetical protein
MNKNRETVAVGITLVIGLVLGQIAAFLVAPESWRLFVGRLPVVLAMVAFWGPICALISAVFIYIVLRLLGFGSLEAIRRESVAQNNPTPAILFVGTLIASLLFLALVIRT